MVPLVWGGGGYPYATPDERDVLEGGGTGVWLGPPPPPRVPLWSPAEGGPKNSKRKSSWHRRRRSKILAVSCKHWKGRRGGGRGGYPPLLLRCTAILILPSGGGGGGDVAFGALFSSAAGGAYWPIAIRCPSLGRFSSIFPLGEGGFSGTGGLVELPGAFGAS